MKIKFKEAQVGQEQVVIYYSFEQSPHGQFLIGVCEESICYLGFADQVQFGALEDLKSRWPKATYIESKVKTKPMVKKFLEGLELNQSWNLDFLLMGTLFQHEVWQELLKIPKGKTSTYKEIAQSIGRPRAMRAVGSAVGANPLGLVVPCHRVIHANGQINGFRWGLEKKKYLLNIEGVATI